MRHEIPEKKSVADRRILFSVFAVLGMLPLITSHAAFCADAQEVADNHAFSIADITAEWWNRESRFKTVQMSWHLARDSGYGSGGYQLEFPPADDRKQAPVFEEIWFSGDQICYEARRWYAELNGEFAGYDNEYLFSEFVRSMRDGHDDVTKWDRPSYRFRLIRDNATHHELLDGVDGTPPLGTIRNSRTALMLNSENQISAGLLFWPALMAFRPTIALGVTPTNHGLVAQAEPSMIGEYRCIVVTGQFGPESTLRLWVVPDMEFAVVRALVSSKGCVQQQIDIDYEREQNAGWFPSAWKITESNLVNEYPGQSEVFQSVKVEVDGHLVNGPVDSTRFNMEFPIDTIVNDKVMNTAYVILSDAKPRSPNSHELRLLSGKAEPHLVKSGVLLSRNAITGSALAAALVTLWVLRRRRMGSSINKSTAAPQDMTSGCEHVR